MAEVRCHLNAANGHEKLLCSRLTERRPHTMQANGMTRDNKVMYTVFCIYITTTNHQISSATAPVCKGSIERVALDGWDGADMPH